MTAHSLTTAAIANAGMLRDIRDAHAEEGAPVTLDVLAQLNPDTRRDILKRSLGRLIDDGILELRGDAYHLTAAGARALLALDVAEGLVEGGLRLEHEAARQQRWPIDKLYPNPDNPVRPIDDERDANFRESIVSACDVIQPLVLSPVDATGGRMIWAGHRRWENCRILAEDEMLPAALHQGLPFVELDVPASIAARGPRAIALHVALIENHQRADVPPWEDAKQLALLSQLLGEEGKPAPARQVALAIGRAHAGSEKGVKDVQRKIKVVLEGRLEDIQRHEHDPAAYTWEMLRDSVSEKKPGLTPKQLLRLVEVCDYLVGLGALPGLPAVAPVLSPGDLGGDYGLVMAGKLGFKGGGDRFEVMVFEDSWRLVAEAGHLRNDDAETAQARRRRLLDLRCTVVSPAKAQLAEHAGRYITEWLNVPVAAKTEAAPVEATRDETPTPGARGVIDPNNDLIVDGKVFGNYIWRDEYLRRVRGEGGAGSPSKPRYEAPNAAEPAAAQADEPVAETGPDPLALGPHHYLAMLELAQKLEAVGEDSVPDLPGAETHGVRIDRYWTSKVFNDLIGEPLKLVALGHSEATGGKPYAGLTRAGEDWIIAREWDDMEPAAQARVLELARYAAGCPDWSADDGYVTDWLNVTSPESQPLAAEAADLAEDADPQIDPPAPDDVAQEAPDETLLTLSVGDVVVDREGRHLRLLKLSGFSTTDYVIFRAQEIGEDGQNVGQEENLPLTDIRGLIEGDDA